MVKYQIFQSENIKSSLNSATLWLCFYSSSLSLFLISQRQAFLNLLQICPFLQLAGPDVELAGFKTFDLEQKYLSSGVQHFISEPGASGLEGWRSHWLTSSIPETSWHSLFFQLSLLKQFYLFAFKSRHHLALTCVRVCEESYDRGFSRS